MLHGGVGEYVLRAFVALWREGPTAPSVEGAGDEAAEAGLESARDDLRAAKY
jgi:hypothetical protein